MAPPPVAPCAGAGGQAGSVGIQWLQAQLKFTADHDAFSPEVAKDLGGDKFRRLLSLAKEGVLRVQHALEASSCGSEASHGGVRTSCAVFDGLRIAKRCIALTLIEAQEATALTADGVAALKNLEGQLAVFVSAAQGEFGAAKCLRTACDSLSSSGLDGTEALLQELESAISTAQRMTHGLKDAEPVALAGSLRRLEADLRPLIRSLDPTASARSTEVLWETRVVNVGDIMTEALRSARAEAGGWAVCADAATDIRALGDAGLVQVAAAYDSVSELLRDEGLEAGARSLHAVRKALTMNTALTPAREDDTELAPLLQDVPRWLRDFVGAAAILRDTAEHRLGAHASSSSSDAGKIRGALLRAAECLDAGPELSALAPWRLAMAEFQEALASASKCGLRPMLTEIDMEVLQVLGRGWAHVPLASRGPADAADAAAATDTPRDGDGRRPPSGDEASAEGREEASSPGAAASAARAGGKQQACCALL